MYDTYFDLEKLRYEMNALTVENFDITLTGFSQIELEDINKTLDCGKLRLSETYEDKNKEIDLKMKNLRIFLIAVLDVDLNLIRRINEQLYLEIRRLKKY